jgi:predicted Zn-dependent protease
MICDGMTSGAILSKTLLPALQLDRLLGHEANASGMSFLPPASETLGAMVCSPHLTVTANPSHAGAPAFGAAKWDDEGVEIESFPVITAGTVRDGFGSRRTLAELPTPRVPHGCVRTDTAVREPLGAVPAIHMAPGTGGASLDALARTLGTGLLLRGGFVYTDPSRGYGTMHCGQRGTWFEVKNGQVTRQINGMGALFSSKKLWGASLAVVGGAETALLCVDRSEVGQPTTPSQYPITAPAMIVKGISLVDFFIRR